jgi:hypothetical protein
VAEVPLESTTFEPFGVTGDSLKIFGEQDVKFQMGRVSFTLVFSQQVADLSKRYCRDEFLGTVTSCIGLRQIFLANSPTEELAIFYTGTAWIALGRVRAERKTWLDHPCLNFPEPILGW